ncbi:zinc-binding dehydrogenase [Nonomuraea sp. NPDC050536]|uniref:zinc-binding dehydrogenase n=1 Tax=Nonomuraea sp. NPDC050536 TaxID=3364366 RepID=UPI0037C54639
MIDSTVPAEPWETTVASLLRIAVRPDIAPTAEDELERVLAQAFNLVTSEEPTTAAFRARLGLTALDVATAHTSPNSTRLAAAVIDGLHRRLRRPRRPGPPGNALLHDRPAVPGPDRRDRGRSARHREHPTAPIRALDLEGTSGQDREHEQILEIAMPLAADLADQGRLTVPLQAVFPLKETATAHDVSAAGHARGKIIVAVP